MWERWEHSNDGLFDDILFEVCLITFLCIVILRVSKTQYFNICYQHIRVFPSKIPVLLPQWISCWSLKWKHYNHRMFLIDKSERSQELHKLQLQRDHWFWILKIGCNLQPSNYTASWTPDKVLHIKFSSLNKKSIILTKLINTSQNILYSQSWQTKVYMLNFAFHLFQQSFYLQKNILIYMFSFVTFMLQLQIWIVISNTISSTNWKYLLCGSFNKLFAKRWCIAHHSFVP